MAEFGGFYGCATTKLLPLVNDRREVLMIMTGAELPVGFVDVDAESDPVDALNVSWFVAPEFRGRGIATQALKLLADTRPGWQLIAAVRPPNIPSLGVARAAGFVEIGRSKWGEIILRRPARPAG